MIKHSVIRSLILALALTPFAAKAEKLLINSNESDPAPKATFTKVVDEFKKHNPDLQVAFNTVDHEGYKIAVRNWLTTEPPDVVFWFAGNRMKASVDRGLLDDVSDIWKRNNYDQKFKSTLPAITVGGKQWGIPISYYRYYDPCEKEGIVCYIYWLVGGAFLAFAWKFWRVLKFLLIPVVIAAALYFSWYHFSGQEEKSKAEKEQQQFKKTRAEVAASIAQNIYLSEDDAARVLRRFAPPGFDLGGDPKERLRVLIASTEDVFLLGEIVFEIDRITKERRGW